MWRAALEGGITFSLIRAGLVNLYINSRKSDGSSVIMETPHITKFRHELSSRNLTDAVHGQHGLPSLKILLLCQRGHYRYQQFALIVE